MKIAIVGSSCFKEQIKKATVFFLKTPGTQVFDINLMREMFASNRLIEKVLSEQEIDALYVICSEGEQSDFDIATAVQMDWACDRKIPVYLSASLEQHPQWEVICNCVTEVVDEKNLLTAIQKSQQEKL